MKNETDSTSEKKTEELGGRRHAGVVYQAQ